MREDTRPPCPKCKNPEPVVYQYGPGDTPRVYCCHHCGMKFRPTLKGISILWQPVDLQTRLTFPLELQEMGG